MSKRSLLLALGIAACAVPFWPEVAAARTCNVQSQSVLPDSLAELLGAIKDEFGAGDEGEGAAALGEHALKLWGIIHASPSVESLLARLENDLIGVASTSFHQEIDFEINNGYADLYAALDVAYRQNKKGLLLTDLSVDKDY